MGLNILVLKGQSRYNVLRIAADDIIRGFNKLGHRVSILDLCDKEDLTIFLKYEFDQYDLVYSFQALYYEDCCEDGTYAKFTLFPNTKFFGHIVDEPILHRRRLSTEQSDNMYIGVIDRSHVGFIEKYFKGVKNKSFVPHGGFKCADMKPFAERNIDVFFPSSYINPMDILEVIDQYPPVFAQMAEHMIVQMLDNPMLTSEDALLKYLEQIRFDCTLEEQYEILSELTAVEAYVRNLTRHNLIYELLEHGIPVTVCGQGWDKFICEYKSNLWILGENGLDLQEVNEIMGNSKIVLNHLPSYQQGTHERIYTSIRCGAISVTLDFPIIRELFTDDENIILFQQNDIETLSKRIRNIIENPRRGQVIAEKGQAIAEENHKWEDNAARILKIVGLE